jgi:hypothetical protein
VWYDFYVGRQPDAVSALRAAWVLSQCGGCGARVPADIIADVVADVTVDMTPDIIAEVIADVIVDIIS